MTLPSSTISMTDVAGELGVSVIGLDFNNAEVRTLAGAGANPAPVSMGMLHSKSFEQDFVYDTAGHYTFTLRRNVRYITISMIGGGGGGGGNDASNFAGSIGGEGHHVQLVIDTSWSGFPSMSTDRTVDVYVGGGGGGGWYATGGGAGAGGTGYYDGGRGGHSGSSGESGGGGGGGGASAVLIGGVLIGLAGGGGGGGGAGQFGIADSAYNSYVTGSWKTKHNATDSSLLTTGQAGFDNVGDGGGGGGGGGGSGESVVAYSAGMYASLPSPIDPTRGITYEFGGHASGWGAEDYTGPGGGVGYAYYDSRFTSLFSPGRFSTSGGAPGGAGGAGAAGKVRVHTKVSSYLEGFISEIYADLTDLQLMSPYITPGGGN